VRVGKRRSRAAIVTAKAMEGVKSLEAAPRNLPAYGARNAERVTTGTWETLPGPTAPGRVRSERRVL
jgi:hypothetical protein